MYTSGLISKNWFATGVVSKAMCFIYRTSQLGALLFSDVLFEHIEKDVVA